MGRVVVKKSWGKLKNLHWGDYRFFLMHTFSLWHCYAFIVRHFHQYIIVWSKESHSVTYMQAMIYKIWNQLNVKKTYDYMPVMMAKILRLRNEDVDIVTRQVSLNESDPALLAPTIAEKPPPPSNELFIARRSRMGFSDLLLLILDKYDNDPSWYPSWCVENISASETFN